MESKVLSSREYAQPARPDWKRRVLVTTLTLAWLVAVGGFFHWSWTYQTTAGEPASAPLTWPAASAIQHDSARPKLIMFLHPFCSCSRASLTELRELVARNPGKLDVSVLLLPSPVNSAGARDSGLWQIARSIPDIQLLADDGAEARRFGARTSGQLTLYGKDGKLMFSGGITESRGHVGNNRHLVELVTLIAGGNANGTRLAPVYGCSLGDLTKT